MLSGDRRALGLPDASTRAVLVGGAVRQNVFSVASAIAVILSAPVLVLTVLHASDGNSAETVAVAAVKVLAVVVLARRTPVVLDRVGRSPYLVVIAAVVWVVGDLLAGRQGYEYLYYLAVVVFGGLVCISPGRVALLTAAVLGVGAASAGGPDAAASIVIVVLGTWVAVDRLARYAITSTVSGHGFAVGAPAISGGAARLLPERTSGDVGVGGRGGVEDSGWAGVAAKLSSRQLEVVCLIGGGAAIAEAADMLGISSKQVSRHLAAARRRTGCATNPQLLAWCAAHGLFGSDADALPTR